MSLRRTVALGALLPLLATSVLLWATSDREDVLDRVPVAVVNEDVVVKKPQPMAAGRALAASLTQPSGDGPDLDWTLSDQADAEAGLRDGDYYAVLHIPKDFSQAILSTGGDDPVRGRLTLTSNAAASTTVPMISRAVATAAAQSLGAQASEGYLGQVYDGFNQLAQGNQQAASSAQQLADGTDQLAAGAGDLDTGTAGLAQSLAQLAAGASELAVATGEVSRGSGEVASGADDLARGAARLEDGSADLARGARELAGADARLARGAREVADGAERAARGSARVAGGARALARDVRRLTRVVCRRDGRGPDVVQGRACDRLQRVTRRASVVAGVTTRLARADRAVARGARGVAGGAARAAGGARGLAGGASSLDRGVGELAGSSTRLAAGARRTAGGAAQVDDSAGTLAGGAQSAAGAGAQVADGSAQLSSSAVRTDDGAQQLSQGLGKAAKESPSYTKDQKKALEKVVSQPVQLTSSVENTDHGNGWLVALVVALVLWLAALLGTAVRSLATALREADGAVSSRRLALAQLLPAAGVAALQGVAAGAALLVTGTPAASPAPLVVLSVLAAVCFTAVGVGLRWAFGAAGVAAYVVLLVVQAAALGNAVPIETAPPVLQTLNGLLPLTAYVDAASQLVSGGSVGSTAGAATALVGWTLLGTLLATTALQRRRSSGRGGLPALAALVGVGSR